MPRDLGGFQARTLPFGIGTQPTSDVSSRWVAAGRARPYALSLRFRRMRAIGSSVSGTNGRPVSSSQTWM